MIKNPGAATALTVLFFLPAAAGVVSLHQPPAKAIHASYRAAQDQGEARPEPPSLPAIRLIFGSDAVAKYCGADTEEQKKDWSHKYICDIRISDVYIALFTLLLCFVTAGLAWFGLLQFWDTRILQRAYVTAAPGGIDLYRSLDGRLSCDILLQNSGNLPARNVRWFIDRQFAIDGALRDFPINEDLIGGNNIIPPKGKMRKGGPAINAAELDAFRHRIANSSEAAKGNWGWLYVWGRVRYKDGFDRERFTDFCFRYSLAGHGWTIHARHGRQHEHGNGTDEDA